MSSSGTEEPKAGLAASAPESAPPGPWAELCHAARRFLLTVDADLRVLELSILEARADGGPHGPMIAALFTGNSLSQLLPPASALALREAVQASLGKALPTRCDTLPQQARDAWVCAISPIFGASVSGKRVHCLFEAVDSNPLTELRSTSQANAQRLDEAMSYAQMGWFERDLETSIGIGSASLAKIYGLTRPEGPWHYDEIRARILPEDRDRHTQAMAVTPDRYGDTANQLIRYRIQRPDGELRTLEIRYRNIVEQERPRAYGFVLDVTEATRAAEELQAYKSWLDMAVQSAGIVLWERDLHTGALRTSPNWTSFYGLAPTESGHMHQAFLDCVVPEDRDVLMNAQSGLLQDGTPYTPRFRVQDEAGQIRQLRSIGHLVRNAQGQPAQLLGCTWDITAESDAANARDVSEERLKQLARLVPGMVFQLRQRAGGHLEMPYASEGILELFGVSPKDVKADASILQAMIAPADLDEVLRQLQESAETHLPLQVEFRVRNTNGQMRSLYAHANPVQDADGTLWHGHVTDISHRRADAERLRNSEAQLNLALASARMTFWQWDLAKDTFKRSRANDSQRRKPPEESPMERVLELVHPDELAALSESFAEVAASGSRSSFTLEHRLCWGRHRESWVETRARGIFDEHGELVMFSGVTIDVSQRKSAEHDRERLRTQLGQAQKMESIGMLTSGIAHDFNNILGSILGYAGLAMQRYAGTSPPKLAEYLNEVVTAGERARDLVAQLLAFSRGESVAVQATAIGPIIEQSLRMLRPALPSSVNVQLNLASNLPLVMANAVQFQQVLVNLCVNARDATNGNGVITVSAAPVELEPVACASCHQNFSGRFVALTVEDTGEGIPEAARLRIFEPFFTTKAQGKGSGMGLAMVHGIVHRQGGHILLDSKPNAGTRFRLLMPVSADAAEETPTLPSAEQKLSAATANIMVVDDEPTVAGFMRELLELSGYTVSVFTAPEAALKAFQEDPGHFDVVVTDQTMPGLTGDQLAARMMPLKPGLPIILVSGHSAVVDEKTALGLGIRAFLRKPLRHAALLEQIHAALQLTPDLD